MNEETLSINSKQRLKQANKTTIIGSMLNVVLSLAKLVAGIIGQSQAMVADGIHSLSDLASDIVVLIGMFFASNPEDESHNYGHGKFETLATLVIALILGVVGLGIGISSVSNIISFLQGNSIIDPHLIAFIAAILSIIIKELLFRYTIYIGKKINSPAIIANAHHHRSDAFSSIGTAVGIGGAILLGDTWVILDPIAGIIVSILIVKEAFSIGKNSINELLEAALPIDIQNKIIEIALTMPGVYEPHNLRTRRIGNVFAIDLHININSDNTIEYGHNIINQLESKIKKELGNDLICNLHIDPQ